MLRQKPERISRERGSDNVAKLAVIIKSFNKLKLKTGWKNMKYKACFVLILCGVWLLCYVSPSDTGGL